MVDISTVGNVGAKKVGVGEHLAEGFPNTYRFGIGTLLVAGQIELEKRPKGVWYYIVVYGNRAHRYTFSQKSKGAHVRSPNETQELPL